MTRSRAWALAILGLVLSGPDAAHAQDAIVERGHLTVLVSGGGSAYSRLQNVTVQSVETQTSQPATLTLGTTTALGAAATYWLRDWLGIRIGGSYAPGSFTLRMQEADRDSLLGPDAGPERLRFSDISVYTTSAAIELSMRARGRRVVPYMLLGAGTASFFADDKDAHGMEAAMDGSDSRTLFAPMLGLGMRVQLADGRVGLVFQLSDHIVRSPVPANDDRTLYDDGNLTVTNRSHPRASDDSAYRLHDVTFSAGLLFRTW